MSIDVTLSRSSTEYLDAVRSGLLDLDEDDRDAILRELEAHLSELAEQDPREALGDPESFVAEFRHSAGLEAHRRPGVVRRIVAAGRRGVQRVSDHPATAPFHNHRSELRTVWVWTRGWILLSAIWWGTAYWAGSTLTFGIPWSDNGSTVPGVLMIASATAGSVWLAGRRGDHRWTLIDRLVTGATVVLVVFAWLNPVWIDGPTDESQVYISELSISNIYAYDRSGEPIEALLFDQDGRPLDVSPGQDDLSFYGEAFYDAWGPLRYETDLYGRPITNLYPLERLTEGWDGDGPVFEPVPPPRVAIPELPVPGDETEDTTFADENPTTTSSATDPATTTSPRLPEDE